ncbi:hypothetical protein V5F32_04940 [Xanthobacter oligotrophicus]|uniref:Uncharacterized protein n=1 Tax=Xanthobacter oligotrophicus TaxID=2607286 RepID=A0ABW6ZS09_9HYPH
MAQKKLSPEGEVLAAHMAATRAAFQVLISCLQRNGTLERGEYQEMLSAYMESVKSTGDPMMLALMDDLRRSLLD